MKLRESVETGSERLRTGPNPPYSYSGVLESITGMDRPASTNGTAALADH